MKNTIFISVISTHGNDETYIRDHGDYICLGCSNKADLLHEYLNEWGRMLTNVT